MEEKNTYKDVFVSDIAGYFINLIMNLFSIIFKGKEISRKGAHAFALSILTASTLIPNTTFPTNVMGFIKMYIIPLVFLSYFIIDVLQNFDWFDRFLKKIQGKNDLACEDIKSDIVTSNDVENLLYSISFTCEQLKEIVLYLRKNNQFTRTAQYYLLTKSKKFSIKTDNYIKQSLKIDAWDSLAVCIYLKRKRFNLSDDFIKELYVKYKYEPTVVFNIGQYHHFLVTDDLNKKFLLAGKNMRWYTPSIFKTIVILYLIVIMSPFIWVFFNYPPPYNSINEMLYPMISLFIFAVGLYLTERSKYELHDFLIKKSLKNQDIDLSTINLSKFLDEVTLF